MSKLAIKGGPRLRQKFFPYQSTIGQEETKAVMRVMESLQLSSYRGSWNDAFWGGKEVRAFEEEWATKFGMKHAIACNSCTSALWICLAAAGIKPGDEVLVTPYSMTVSATMPILFGAIPVFCDVEPDNYCLSYREVVKRTTKKTKAIIAVDLFGNPFDPEIYKFAKERGIIVIEDAAQAPGAMVREEYVGSYADMTCYSFTQGKILNSGEGGLITTNSSFYDLECRLFMNHKESVINDMYSQGYSEHIHPSIIDCSNQVGQNLRMTELVATIMREQLKKLDWILEIKRTNCNYLERYLIRLPGISATGARSGCVHSYYVQPFLFDESKVGISRNRFIEAFKEELMPEEKRDVEGTGILVGSGYIQPLYRMPMFKNIHIKCIQHEDILGKNTYETKINQFYNEDHIKINYPIVEDLWKNKLFILRLSSPPISIENDLVDVVAAFHKVYENRGELE